MPGWGSWEWVGATLLDGLDGTFDTRPFGPWEMPGADAVVVVKHAPPPGWVAEVARRAALIYCPVDYYATAAEVDADAPWLRRCAGVVVHCRRLTPYFAPLTRTTYLDHPLRYAAPPRRAFQPDGRLLWVGVRSNLPPVVAWVNDHPLPAPLDVLTNPERPGEVPPPEALGFRPDRDVRVVEWTAARHREFTAAARAALDVKGDDFRSRHKPPAKALDLVASNVPLALNPGSSPAEHLAALGLDAPSPLDPGRWLSERYWLETCRLGERLARELEPGRVAERARDVVTAALEGRPPGPAATAVPDAPRGPALLAAPPAESAEPDAATTVPRLFGLMVTKDDAPVFGDWCRDQLRLYDAVVCLDGSGGDETARIAERFAGRLVYLRERDVRVPHRTNHGLRRVVHEEIVRRYGAGHWVMCCHPDEFCHHDPRAAAARAAREGYDHVRWLVPHFYPHPSELADWPARRHLLVPDRFRHYHWDHHGSGLPWVEDRLYRAGPGVEWDDRAHDTVRPLGLLRPAPFLPTLRHYKVLDPDPARYEVDGRSSRHRGRWEGAPARPGLPFPVRRVEDFFVDAVPGYGRCDRFDGAFPHPWASGGEAGLGLPPAEAGAPDQRYRAARDLAATDPEAARVRLEPLAVEGVEPRVRALAHNDLAALAAVRGDHAAARAGFAAALVADPGCRPARANLETLGGPPVPNPAPRPLTAGGAPASPRPVRVAVLSLLFNWPTTGGGNVHTAELTRFLAAAGYDVRHLYARFEPWGVGRVAAPTPHPAEGLEFDPPDWTAGGITRRFRGAVDAFDPDWVVLTDSWNLKPVLADAAGGRPYVLRLQALECLCPLNNVRLLPGPGGRAVQCTRHQLATPGACERCVRDNGHTSGGLHRAERAIAGVGTPEYRDVLVRAFAGAAAVFAVNPLAAAMVEPHARDVRVVTAGMDPARFPWPPAGRPAGPARVVFAGLTGEWMKGFAVLREACGRLWRDRRDFELVVTDAPPAGPAEPFARYVGWQSQADLPPVLAAADVVAVPTVAQEALGRTAVEAMAAGKPVVASRIGGLPFTVADGATGVLCAPGDAADLASQLARLLDDAPLRGRLGAAGRRRFEEHYAWPVVVERHYRPLFGGPAPADR